MLRTSHQWLRIVIQMVTLTIQPSKVYRMPWHNKNQNRLCRLASPPRTCSKRIKTVKNNKAVNKRIRASKRRLSKLNLSRLKLSRMPIRPRQRCLRPIRNCWPHNRRRQLIVLRRVLRCQPVSLLSAIIKKYRTSNGTISWPVKSASTSNLLRK